MNYTLSQLIDLRDFYSKNLDGDFFDDKYCSDRSEFVYNTTVFFDWLKRLEDKNKINNVLKTIEFRKQFNKNKNG